MSDLPAWHGDLTHRDWLFDGSSINTAPMLARWIELDWSKAWMDMGPSPAGNPGPYWHVPMKDGETTHRLYPKLLKTKWLLLIREVARASSHTSPTFERVPMREQAIHESLCQWLTLALPREAFFFHPANGEYRNVITGARLKRMGLKAGVPDLVVLYGGKAVFLEIKAPKKYLSPEQREVHAALKLAGCDVFVIHSLMEAQMALELCGIPLFASVAA